MPASPPSRDASVPLLALAVAAIAAVELALIAPGHVLAGQVADAVLVFALANAGRRRSGPRVAALRALVLIPLARVFALGLPMRRWSEPVDDLLVALPLAFAAVRLAPAVGLDLRAVTAVRRPALRWWAILAGAALGLLAYLLGDRVLLPPSASPARVLLAVMAAVATATTTELIFRGLLQMTLQRVAARAGVLVAAGLFTATFARAGPAALVLTFALAGLLFAAAVARTGAIAGAIAGNVALALGAGVVWPALLGRSPPTSVEGRGTTLALAVAVAAATAFAASRPAVPPAPRQPRPARRWLPGLRARRRIVVGGVLAVVDVAILLTLGAETARVLALEAAVLAVAAALLGSGAAQAVEGRRRSRAEAVAGGETDASGGQSTA